MRTERLNGSIKNYKDSKKALWSRHPLEITKSNTQKRTKLENTWSWWHTWIPVLKLYLPIASGRIVEFVPFSGVLKLYKMQTASLRVWTWVANTTFYNDNHYMMSISILQLRSKRCNVKNAQKYMVERSARLCSRRPNKISPVFQIKQEKIIPLFLC